MLMLVALVLAATPITSLHAHEGGGSDHSHDAGASAPAHADQDHGGQQPQVDAPDPGTLSIDSDLHVHEVGTQVSNLPSIALLILPDLIPATPDVGLPSSSPPTAARTPPHRPPIA